jgi:hypothetical protein
MKIGNGNRSTRRKSGPAPLCPPQIPLDQTQARTRAAAVGSQRLTAWAIARPPLVITRARLFQSMQPCVITVWSLLDNGVSFRREKWSAFQCRCSGWAQQLTSTTSSSSSLSHGNWLFLKSKSNLLHFVLASRPLRPTTRDFVQLNPCCNSPYATSPLTRCLSLMNWLIDWILSVLNICLLQGGRPSREH